MNAMDPISLTVIVLAAAAIIVLTARWTSSR
jgi:energy-converting hydrogenase Eha subunit C